MLLCDFHIHSTFSDGLLTIPELIDLYGCNGFDVIAITDHICETDSFIGLAAHQLEKSLSEETFPKYMEVLAKESARAMKEYGLLVIPGFELTKNALIYNRSAHILGIGINEFVSANLSVIQMTNEIRWQGGLSVAAHPVSTKKWEAQTYFLWDNREMLKSHIDVWEVASGSVLFDEVLESGLPLIASSDLHQPRQIRSWKTLLNCEKNLDSVLEAIRNQQLSFCFFEPKFAVENSTSHKSILA